MHKFPLILILIIFVTGCGSDGDVSQPDVVEIHKGHEGLVMNFLENLPPEDVWFGSDFTLGLELKNKGTYEIKDGRIVFGGFNQNYISLDKDELDFDIDEKSIAYPEGGYDIVNLNARSIGIPEGAEEYNVVVTARAYYNYETEASAEVCIDPNHYTTYFKVSESACTVGPISLSDGQGAPIAVTKIIQGISSLRDENKIPIKFNIYIANKGQGEVTQQIKLEEARLSNEKIECLNNEITIKDNEEEVITCETTVEKSKGAYLAPLTIKLSYEYTQKLTKSFNIKDLTQTT